MFANPLHHRRLILGGIEYNIAMPPLIVHLHQVILIQYIVRRREYHLLFEIRLKHLPVKLLGPDGLLFEVFLNGRDDVGVDDGKTVGGLVGWGDG